MPTRSRPRSPRLAELSRSSSSKNWGIWHKSSRQIPLDLTLTTLSQILSVWQWSDRIYETRSTRGVASVDTSRVVSLYPSASWLVVPGELRVVHSSQTLLVHTVARSMCSVQEYGSLRLFNPMMRSASGSMSARITRLPHTVCLCVGISCSPANGLS